MHSRSVFSLIILLLLNACSTMSGKECAVADWSAIGYEDGQNGRLLSYRNERAQDCAKHEVKLDNTAYNQGRDRGLQQYCTEQTGYKLGKDGHRYNGVCADHNEPVFLAAYTRGGKHGEFISSLRKIESKISDANNELSKLGRDFDSMIDRGISLQSETSSDLDYAIENRQRALYLKELFLPYWYEQKRVAEQQLVEFEHTLRVNERLAMDMAPYPFEEAPEQDQYFGMFHALTDVTRELFPEARRPGEHYVNEACTLYDYANREIARVSEFDFYEEVSLIHDDALSALDSLKSRPEYARLFRDGFRSENMAIKVSRFCPEQYNQYRRYVRRL